MLAEFSVVPMGNQAHMGREVAQAIKIVKQSGLPYQVTAMGTIVEGSRQEVLRVIQSAHEKLLETHERVYTRIVLDEFQRETPGRMQSKVAKVEKELGPL